MKVLVCGGRKFADYEAVREALDEWLAPDCDVIIHGGASGADSLAGRYAREHGFPCEVYKADWEKHPKAAGPIRNQRMLDDGRPSVVLAFAGGRGTADMVRRAKLAGVRVKEYA